jgi:hypothetical protein
MQYLLPTFVGNMTAKGPRQGLILLYSDTPQSPITRRSGDKIEGKQSAAETRELNV